MTNNSILQKLIDAFMKFPGIGPRQARRFVYYLLEAEPQAVEALVLQIQELKKSASQCADCGRFFSTVENGRGAGLCLICRDSGRELGALMVVEKDIDLENIERAGIYRGRYFVLGGLMPILDNKDSPQSKRIKNLVELISRLQKKGLKEIIIALSVSPEGDFTAELVKGAISPLLGKPNLRLSSLGRGLSSGSELEYSDSETLKNALKNRG